MQIFDTVALNRVVETMVDPIDFFTTNYFGPTQVSDSETIMFDVIANKRRITPVVHPMVRGKVIEGPGYTTKSFQPAYLKDKRVFNPNKYFSRLPGERIGGSMTPAQRLQSSVAWHVDDQMKMLARRKEVWAAEVLRTGGLVVKGDGYEQVNIAYGRDPSLTITLTGSNKWGSANISPLANLEDWASLIFKLANVSASTVVMTLDVWKVLRADPVFLEQLNTLKRYLQPGQALTAPLIMPTDGVQYVGHVGQFDFYVYAGKYVDPLDNTEKDILPAGTVLLLSNDIDGVYHYGAIKDLKAGLQPRQYFVKSWEEEDPSQRMMLMQSAPLPVAYRPNASLSATVL